MARILQTTGAGALLLLALTACSAEGTVVSYSGPYDGEVAACAEIASAGALRQDRGVPSRIWVDMVEAEQTDVSGDGNFIRYVVTGVTHATAPEEHRYEWKCVLEKDLLSMTLTAKLDTFALLN